jgi:hypothetical protein
MVAGPVRLTGLLEPSQAPNILQRTDQAFIPGILEELERGTDGLASLTGTLAGTRDEHGRLKLFHPVQRTFHVAVLETFCHSLGEPRLTRKRIESMGLVLRRLAADSQGNIVPNRLEAWCSAGSQLRGWIALGSPAEEDQDPEPARRPPVIDAGHPDINRRLDLLYGLKDPLTESVSPLFAAPPSACDAVNRTVVYGMIPVTSSDISEVPDPAAQEAVYTSPEMAGKLVKHFTKYLTASNGFSLPKSSQMLASTDAASTDAQMQDFLLALRQVAVELDAFGSTPQAKALYQVLQTISLPISDDPVSTQPAGEFLAAATRFLLELEGPAVRMPLRWPTVSQSQADSILKASQAGLAARRALVKPNEGRFDLPGRLYQIRAFIRVLNDDGCSPELVWSQYSEPFTIAQWYESGNAPPVQILLPDLSNKEALKRLKPNVAFVVPESLQNMLSQNMPKKLADGEGGKGSGSLGIDWLCSFSLPIITLCAFIVLNIFLGLFNIIFNWMLFLKICIPIPKRN